MAISFKMSLVLYVSGNESILKSDHFPPLHLPVEYEMALTGLSIWNSIPNVTSDNNIFYYGAEGEKKIEIPVGSYELNDIADYLEYKLKENETQDSKSLNNNHKELGDKSIILRGNRQTLKSELICKYLVDFTKPKNIGNILGFNSIVLPPFKMHVSNDLVNIMQVDTVRIECNIVTGSYSNGEPSHAIYEFSIGVPPGYIMIEVPKSAIYLPVFVRSISNVELRICDQDGNLLNLRNEKTRVRLHLRPRNAYNI